MKGIIYLVENINNEMIYVGATTKSINERKWDHHSKSKSNKGNDFQRAIDIYGINSFKWREIYTTMSVSQLAEMEKYYISKFKKSHFLYNSDSGGGFKKSVYQYNIEDGSLEAIFDGLQEAGNSISATKQSISSACLSINKTYGGYYWSYDYKEPFKPDNDGRKKKVVQFDLDKNYINQYLSVSEASLHTGINKSCISKVCRNERFQSGGYIWQYA